MTYTYKNGYREGVVFAFIKDDKVLIEKRPIQTGCHELFFPSGSIEDKDYFNNIDYKIHALYREVSEEFEDKVEIKKYIYLDEMKAHEIKIVFYIYLITDWVGDIPKYTVENGEKDSDLLWIRLSDKDRYFSFESAFEICKRIEKTNHGAY
ncbi:hypothetical protein PV797_19750 [Clostridiaceae bacterium M8S5]|nr:hypothetical protein PV797_19750 [Clostridiaceae bacterium M8S5]